MIELKGITKYFYSNGVAALDHAGFTLAPKEIHALLGENGAGKSTLMQIMAGYMSGGGTILVDGRKRHFKTPAGALAAGIGMVRQHPHPVRGFKVWEDCILGAEKPKSKVVKVMEQWGFDLPLDDPAESLGVSQRQIAAILSLILRDVRYLIFDEPAAVLSPAETEALFKLLRRLKEAGRGIVLISHKLNETLELADRVTVIQRGKTYPSRETSSISIPELEELIFGAEKKHNIVKKQFFVNSDKGSAPVFSARNLSVEVPGKPHIRNINLELTAGKIIGITGVLDSGLETLELALTGFYGKYNPAPARSNRCRISGQILAGSRTIKSVKDFREAGGAYLGSDRLGKNLMPSLPLKESLIIHSHRRSRCGLSGRFGIMNKTFLDSFCAKVMAAADVNRNAGNMAGTFSGGMLQRILLAREFEECHSIFVLSGGSWGLDQQNREKLARHLGDLVYNNTGSGKAALLFSSDPDSLIGMADEILVLRNGSFSARISLAERTDSVIKEIRSAMIGADVKAEQV